MEQNIKFTLAFKKWIKLWRDFILNDHFGQCSQTPRGSRSFVSESRPSRRKLWKAAAGVIILHIQEGPVTVTGKAGLWVLQDLSRLLGADNHLTDHLSHQILNHRDRSASQQVVSEHQVGTSTGATRWARQTTLPWQAMLYWGMQTKRHKHPGDVRAAPRPFWLSVFPVRTRSAGVGSLWESGDTDQFWPVSHDWKWCASLWAESDRGPWSFLCPSAHGQWRAAPAAALAAAPAAWSLTESPSWHDRCVQWESSKALLFYTPEIWGGRGY